MLLTANIEKLQEKTAVVTFSGPLTLGTSLTDGRFTGAGSYRGRRYENGVRLAECGLCRQRRAWHDGVCLRRPQRENGTFRLCGVSSRVLSLLRLTKMDSFLTVDGSREESLAALD